MGNQAKSRQELEKIGSFMVIFSHGILSPTIQDYVQFMGFYVVVFVYLFKEWVFCILCVLNLPVMWVISSPTVQAAMIHYHTMTTPGYQIWREIQIFNYNRVLQAVITIGFCRKLSSHKNPELWSYKVTHCVQMLNFLLDKQA